MDIDTLFILAFAGLIFIFALVCANVGSGGGPSYIAVVVIAGFHYMGIRPAALLLCATLSLVTTFRYYRATGVSWRTLWPLVVGSIPAAYLASGILLSAFAYKVLAAGVLFCNALGWIIGKRTPRKNKTKIMPVWIGLVCGAGVGFLSGLVGIGGATFLLPISIFGGWTSGPDFRATVSAFVFLTSIAALIGNSATLEVASFRQMLYWIPAVLIAGWFGTEFNLENRTAFHLTRLLSVILVAAALKLLISY